jgi:murein DD-endopeptidase MepM/ murein hydrolase activator NlpD
LGLPESTGEDRRLVVDLFARVRDQRFAYDFLIRENGITHAGDGKQNADYFCHGRPITAPAAGRVVATVDGIPENVPGKMDATHPAGNYVIVEHGDGEYSLLAHLIPGSIAVKADERVVAGSVLGRCGNSGNSSEPHLHYHLQTTPTFGDGEGLPAQFHDYIADGNAVSRGEPQRGQSIRSQR